MSAQETMALVAVIVGLIAVASIFAEAYKNRLAFKERALEAKARESSEQAAQSAATAERLEQRVRVLERIATDKSAHLASQIEDMREPAI
jgi:FtsZ-interacting cell division protein ZipA